MLFSYVLTQSQGSGILEPMRRSASTRLVVVLVFEQDRIKGDVGIGIGRRRDQSDLDLETGHSAQIIGTICLRLTIVLFQTSFANVADSMHQQDDCIDERRIVA